MKRKASLTIENLIIHYNSRTNFSKQNNLKFKATPKGWLFLCVILFCFVRYKFPNKLL